MQDEVNSKYKNGLRQGEIAVTSGGGKLKCQEVYHTSLPSWTADDDNIPVSNKA